MEFVFVLWAQHGAVFTAACTKLLMHLLTLRVWNVFLFVKAMQTLIEGSTVHWVSCTQIWSHIIYSSLRRRTVLAVLSLRPKMFPRQPKTQVLRTRREGTQWRLFVMIYFLCSQVLISFCKKHVIYVLTLCCKCILL